MQTKQIQQSVLVVCVCGVCCVVNNGDPPPPHTNVAASNSTRCYCCLYAQKRERLQSYINVVCEIGELCIRVEDVWGGLYILDWMHYTSDVGPFRFFLSKFIAQNIFWATRKYFGNINNYSFKSIYIHIFGLNYFVLKTYFEQHQEK